MTVVITVVDTTPPDVDAGEDVTVEQDRYQGAPATLPTPIVSDLCDADPDVVVDGALDIYPLGDTTVTVTATDASGNAASDTVVVHVVDTTPPVVGCLEAVNPHGVKKPKAGPNSNPKSGQNPDGFYQISAEDICDTDLEIYIFDAAGNQFGPYSTGDVVKITEDPTMAPISKPMGGPNSAVAAHLIVDGDAYVSALDDSGNIGTSPCLVPAPPK